MKEIPYVVRSPKYLIAVDLFAVAAMLSNLMYLFVFRRGDPREFALWAALSIMFAVNLLRHLVVRTTLSQSGIEWRTLLKVRSVRYADIRKVGLGGSRLAVITYITMNNGEQFKIVGMPNQVTRAAELAQERIQADRQVTA